MNKLSTKVEGIVWSLSDWDYLQDSIRDEIFHTRNIVGGYGIVTQENPNNFPDELTEFIGNRG